MRAAAGARAGDLSWPPTMADEKTVGGVDDPAALDRIERRFWRELWDSVPAEVAAEHGIEGELRPVQATVAERPAGACR